MEGFFPVREELVDVIVVATVAETLRRSREGEPSFAELGETAGRVAADFGLGGDLLARLIRHVPELCSAVRSADREAEEAYVCGPGKPQYEIWTAGERKIVEDITAYEKRRRTYVLWVNLTSKECTSYGKRKPFPQPKTLELLLFLLDNVGTSLPCGKVFEQVFEGSPEHMQGWKNRIEQQLTKLEKIAEGGFRKSYLTRDRLNNTLSLSDSFRDRYFVFRKLR